MRTLVIIPAHNEEESIMNTINDLKIVIKQHPEEEVGIVVINDGSKDRTQQILEENNVAHINHIVNMGVGASIKTGIIYAQKLNYDNVTQFDADGQHNGGYIFDLIKGIKDGNDIVIGSRFVGNKKPFSMRMMGSRLLSFFISIKSLGKLKITDPTSGQRMMNKKVQDTYLDDASCSEPAFAIKYFQKGFKVKEIPVAMNERVAGESHFNFINSVKFMLEQSMAILFGF